MNNIDSFNNKIKNSLFAKKENSSHTNKNQRKSNISQLDNPINKIKYGKSKNVSNKSNDQNIKVNTNKPFLIKNQQPSSNCKKFTKNMAVKVLNSSNDKFIHNCRFNSSQNLPNICSEKKEFKKVVLMESSASKHSKNETIDNKISKTLENDVKKSLFIYKKGNKKLKDGKKKILLETNQDSQLKMKMSIKFIKAQEKWKNDYFATVIQKIFRGFLFRKKGWKNRFNSNYLNIYIKKKPENKCISTKYIKAKNLILGNIKNGKNNLNININKNTKDSIQYNLSYLYDTKTLKRDDSSKQNQKIKEIIIKKPKNYPVIQLNLENCLFPNQFNDYNNMNSSLTYRNNDNSKRYWEKLKSINKLRKKFNHWSEISTKNKIIKNICLMTKNTIKVSRSEDTYNSTNSIDEEIIHFGKNPKVY